MRAQGWQGAVAIVLAASWLGSCGSPPLGPMDPGPNTTCRSCRMSVVDVRFAAQIVAADREPMFFDDLGCLRGFLENGTDVPPSFEVFVADHRTKRWVRAASAVFTKVDGLETPMGSGVIAHAGSASRDADPAAKGGEAVDAAPFLPPVAPR